MGKHNPKFRTQKARKGPKAPNKHNKTQPATRTIRITVENKRPNKKRNDLSPKFDLLFNKDAGDLTVATLNVQKIGVLKRKELAKILKENDIDILSVTEHHIKPLNSEDNLDKSVLDHPSLQINGYKVISKHRESGSGGVAWYFKKNLDVIPWDNEQTQANLKLAGRERCWIKLGNTPFPIALGVVYMPVETTNDSNGEKYQQILDVISQDMDVLENDGFKCFLYGDWNAHTGTPEHNPLGIEGNKPNVGPNGEHLLTWLEYTGMLLVNSLPVTEGLWTYQHHNGQSLSVLDYMICDNNLTQHIKGLIIDDNREITTINNDHNMVISILKANHKVTQWPKPPPTTKWDMANINEPCFMHTLKFLMQDAHERRVKNRLTNSATKVLDDINDCINNALSASTKKVSCSPTKKKLPPVIVSLQKEIKATEKERNRILKDHRGSSESMDQDTFDVLNTLNDKIRDLRIQKLEASAKSDKAENKRLNSLIKRKQNSSRAFWKLAKPKEDTSTINAVKKTDGSLTTSHTDCLEEVRKHFQDLFSPRERPKNKEPLQLPKFNHNRHIIQCFKPKDIKKALDKLKSGKASGPDGIPNEVLKLGSKVLQSQLCDAFNTILKTGEDIPAWAEGQLHLLYKGKGDKTNLSNYRGITVNNTTSKVFASLLNDRLTKLAENSGVLGQIQGGGRKNRQGLDSLFILRTILEKSAGKGKTSEQDFSLLFVDLKKAYDKMPQDLQWQKLLKMGLHPNFVKVLKSLYKNSYVTAIVNGFKTGKIWIKSGVKQGCPLSPLLWALFLCDIGQTLENHKGGVLIKGAIISALLFVDDVVLIGRTLSEIEKMIQICVEQFRLNGLEINCSKSKILTREKVHTESIDVHEYCSTLLNDFELQEKYKYLGVTMNLSLSKSGIFSSQIKYILAKLSSFKGQILAQANNSFDKIKVACALWKNIALPTVLYGIEIVKLDKKDLEKLDSIQAEFIALLLGVSSKCSHAGLLKELNWVPISSLIMKRKLKYWVRLSGLPESSWAKKAWLECMSAKDASRDGWKSNYRVEIQNIHGWKYYEK